MWKGGAAEHDPAAGAPVRRQGHCRRRWSSRAVGSAFQATEDDSAGSSRGRRGRRAQRRGGAGTRDDAPAASNGWHEGGGERNAGDCCGRPPEGRSPSAAYGSSQARLAGRLREEEEERLRAYLSATEESFRRIILAGEMNGDDGDCLLALC